MFELLTHKTKVAETRDPEYLADTQKNRTNQQFNKETNILRGWTWCSVIQSKIRAISLL